MKIYVKASTPQHNGIPLRAFEVHYLDYDDNKCIKVIDAVNEDEAERLVGNQSDCSRILYSEEY